MESAGEGDRSEGLRPSAEVVELDESGYANRTFCSWTEAGWRSAVLRGHESMPVVEDFELAGTPDQLVVLTTSGWAKVESWNGRRWRKALCGPGQVSMTAPYAPSRLRWRTTTSDQLSSLHLYVPGGLVRRTAAELFDRDVETADLPDALTVDDPVVEALMRGLARAAEARTDDMYVESAVAFLTVHLLSQHSYGGRTPEPSTADRRVRRAKEYMQDNLHQPMTLAEIAGAVNLSTFHFLRLFAAATGEPPRRYLGRLRVAAARRLLEVGDTSVTDIAYRCGYSSATHLAAAFRREMGTSPTAYRRARRR